MIDLKTSHALAFGSLLSAQTCKCPFFSASWPGHLSTPSKSLCPNDIIQKQKSQSHAAKKMCAENDHQLTCPTCPPDSFLRIPKDSEIIASKKSKIACRMQFFHLFPACNLTVLVREAGRQVLWQACVVSQTINLGWTNKHRLYQNLNAILESLWESIEMLWNVSSVPLYTTCTMYCKCQGALSWRPLRRQKSCRRQAEASFQWSETWLP